MSSRSSSRVLRTFRRFPPASLPPNESGRRPNGARVEGMKSVWRRSGDGGGGRWQECGKECSPAAAKLAPKRNDVCRRRFSSLRFSSPLVSMPLAKPGQAETGGGEVARRWQFRRRRRRRRRPETRIGEARPCVANGSIGRRSAPPSVHHKRGHSRIIVPARLPARGESRVSSSSRPRLRSPTEEEFSPSKMGHPAHSGGIPFPFRALRRESRGEKTRGGKGNPTSLPRLSPSTKRKTEDGGCEQSAFGSLSRPLFFLSRWSSSRPSLPSLRPRSRAAARFAAPARRAHGRCRIVLNNKLYKMFFVSRFYKTFKRY